MVGQLIAWVRYRRLKPAVERKHSSGPDLAGVRPQGPLAEYESVTQLMLEAEKKGDKDVFDKLSDYKSKLEQDLKNCG